MPVTSYASIQQFTDVTPAASWGSRTQADAQRAIDTFSGVMDDSFRGRWILPFAAVGASVSLRCALGARYYFFGGRGFTPVTDADKIIVADHDDVMAWLDKVQRRVLFPDVTPLSTTPNLDQPFVSTSSVVDLATGGTCTNRGW